jgi:hypothetical protein
MYLVVLGHLRYPLSLHCSLVTAIDGPPYWTLLACVLT